MDFKELIASSIASLRANILRTSLTMLGIVIGISSVILIVSIGQGAVTFVTNELSAFGTNVITINPGEGAFSGVAGADSLTEGDVEAIEDDPSLTNIKTVVPNAVSTVRAEANGENANVTIFGSTAQIEDVIAPDIIEGEFFTNEQAQNNENVAVVGVDTAEEFFGEGSSVVGETIRLNNRRFRIVGVARSESALAGGFFNSAVYVPIGIVKDNFPGGDRIQEIDVIVNDPDLINQTIEDIEILLRDRHNIDEGEDDDFVVSSFQDVLSTVQTITNLLTLMVAGISAISLVVGGVGVMNIMLVSVTERTKEIGLLKSIGAKEKDILTQFLIESMVMTFSGGVIGVFIGISGAFAISLLVGIPFTLSFIAIFAAVGVSTLVGLVFGLYPARRAAQLNPIDALRYE
jgi:putative ABC transport system permease protein